jgi:hypothetical protein
MRATTHRSVCPYDCPDVCGLLVTVADGRVVKVAGDPGHPITRGTLCPKMMRYQDTVHSPRRLTRPLERCGPKGSATFRPISWQAAVGKIASRWKQIVSAQGAEAILPYSFAGTMGLVQRNAGHAFFHRLGASLLDRTICSPAKDLGWKAVMGHTPAPSPDSARHSDVIILWGANTAATNIHFLKEVKAAVRQGARVWLVETYRTPTAAFAHRTVLVRPGSDGAWPWGSCTCWCATDNATRHLSMRMSRGSTSCATRYCRTIRRNGSRPLTGVARRSSGGDGATAGTGPVSVYHHRQRAFPVRKRRHDGSDHRRTAGPPGGRMPGQGAAVLREHPPAVHSIWNRCCAGTLSAVLREPSI